MSYIKLMLKEALVLDSITSGAAITYKSTIEVRSAINELQDFIDSRTITSFWEKAISSKWNKDPVWIHGDFASGNILVKDGCVVAIVDLDV